MPDAEVIQEQLALTQSDLDLISAQAHFESSLMLSDEAQISKRKKRR